MTLCNTPYMLLEIKVFWYPDDYDEDLYADLKKKVKLVEGVMIISVEHIVAFHPHDNGNVMVHLSNGEVFEANQSFDSFRQVMEGIVIAKDMFVSGDN